MDAQACYCMGFFLLLGLIDKYPWMQGVKGGNCTTQDCLHAEQVTTVTGEGFPKHRPPCRDSGVREKMDTQSLSQVSLHNTTASFRMKLERASFLAPQITGSKMPHTLQHGTGVKVPS